MTFVLKQGHCLEPQRGRRVEARLWKGWPHAHQHRTVLDQLRYQVAGKHALERYNRKAPWASAEVYPVLMIGEFRQLFDELHRRADFQSWVELAADEEVAVLRAANASYPRRRMDHAELDAASAWQRQCLEELELRRVPGIGHERFSKDDVAGLFRFLEEA